jgi:hypothetical protein
MLEYKINEDIMGSLVDNPMTNLVSGILKVFSPYQIVKRFFMTGIKILTSGTVASRKNKFRAIIIEMEANVRSIRERRDALRKDLAQLKRLLRQVNRRNLETI